MPYYASITGKLPTELANAVSDAIAKAIKDGMDTDEAVSVAINVAADYGRDAYGTIYLDGLAELIIQRGAAPLPDRRERG